uniref:Uncharacterized protein n=2 Tax=Ditylum brightwellii TaxID=49249 RepID=A0A7S4RR62_9STRA
MAANAFQASVNHDKDDNDTDVKETEQSKKPPPSKSKRNNKGSSLTSSINISDAASMILTKDKGTKDVIGKTPEGSARDSQEVHQVEEAKEKNKGQIKGKKVENIRKQNPQDENIKHEWGNGFALAVKTAQASAMSDIEDRLKQDKSDEEHHSSSSSSSDSRIKPPRMRRSTSLKNGFKPVAKKQKNMLPKYVEQETKSVDVRGLQKTEEINKSQRSLDSTYSGARRRSLLRGIEQVSKQSSQKSLVSLKSVPSAFDTAEPFKVEKAQRRGSADGRISNSANARKRPMTRGVEQVTRQSSEKSLVRSSLSRQSSQNCPQNSIVPLAGKPVPSAFDIGESHKIINGERSSSDGNNPNSETVGQLLANATNARRRSLLHDIEQVTRQSSQKSMVSLKSVPSAFDTEETSTANARKR